MADDDAVARWNALSLAEKEARIAASWTPEAEAEHQRVVRSYLASLPDASGTISGHLVTDACYGLGGCGPDCPVWIGEAEDARGPN
jgi:hypothetical protein